MKNKILFTLPLLCFAVACTPAPKGEKIGSVNTLYNSGMDSLQSGDMANAVHTFEELQRQHPYSGWATKAQVMTIYAHYLNEDPAQTAATAESFIQLHPGHDDLPYVYYLRGLAYYNQISDVNRDQGATRKALLAFKELLNRFPDSIYARDARLKETLLNSHLAGKEMAVGRFYLKDGRYLAAVRRFQNVVDHFQETNQIQEALYRLTEAYVAMGLPEEAKKNAAVLGHNYPNSPWYKKAYAMLVEQNYMPDGQAESFLQKAEDFLLKR